MTAQDRPDSLEPSTQPNLVEEAQARIKAAIGSGGSNKAWLQALQPLPIGHTWMHAIGWLDAEVRNGGFNQFYGNGGGVEIPAALEGLRKLGRADIAAIVEESLAYGRWKRRARVEADLHDAPRIAHFATPRPWGQLDTMYLASGFNTTDAFAALLETHRDAFVSPFTELTCAADGRRWRIRRDGWNNQIEIVLADGTAIQRARRFASLSEAEKDAKALIAEQLRDGFVRGA